MNVPLFGLLFTNTEKKLIYSILLDISPKNNFGKSTKPGFFSHLIEMLGIVEDKIIEKEISENAIDKNATVSFLSGWSEDKKTLLKGLVIDMLCYNDKLNKSECLAAIAFLDAAGIEDQSLKNITKVLP
jgi:hypothetical protein